jgi:glycosyltransferase involved in cell wall biosynthesis
VSRLAVIMAGPLPPAVGGIASVIGALSASSFAQRVDLRLFETGKVTPEGRNLWCAVRTRLQVMSAWWRLLGQRPRPLVHIHTCSGLTYFLDGILLLMARLRGAPTVLHIHGGRFDVFLDNLGGFRSALARWLMRRAHAVIVLSEDWRRRLSHRLPGAKFHVVLNGVPAFIISGAGDRSKQLRYLFLGTLGRAKGVHVLLDAATKSRLSWTIDLAGAEGEAGFMEWMRGEIERLGLGGRLRLLGPVVGDAKTELLQSVDGFVLPSLAEGLPMALLEAMAARLPVVVTAVGAIPEVIHDGVEGYLVPPEDAFALADALDRLAANPQARRQMGESAYRTCERGYGIERMVDALLDVYAKLPTASTR